MKTVNSVLDTCKMKVAGAEERGEKKRKSLNRKVKAAAAAGAS